MLVATLLLGVAEVFYDNAAQTFMPSIVHPNNLEKANGRLWSIEQVANTFAGPPLGALLLTVAFSFPFWIDAVTFGVSALLVALIPRPAAPGVDRTGTGTQTVARRVGRRVPLAVEPRTAPSDGDHPRHAATRSACCRSPSSCCSRRRC